MSLPIFLCLPDFSYASHENFEIKEFESTSYFICGLLDQFELREYKLPPTVSEPIRCFGYSFHFQRIRSQVKIPRTLQSIPSWQTQNSKSLRWSPSRIPNKIWVNSLSIWVHKITQLQPKSHQRILSKETNLI